MSANIGLYGLAVMGSNLARNIESHGYTVAVCNRTTSVTEDFAKEFSDNNFIPAKSLEDFVASLECPRKIILMVKAGQPTDAVIDALIPLLEAGDILIDGGNAWFKDTQRREKYCAEKGIYFLGVGISGGEYGALTGPSIMPGGAKNAWQEVSEILAKIAAFVEEPCTNYIGPDGAGHFVKMAHNGIEYADMQLIAEAYHLLKDLLKFSPAEIADTFSNWNQGVLASYLIEITAQIFTVKDTNSDDYLVEKILDKAGQKGTGQWTAEVALELGVPVPTINAAVNARTLSSFKDQRLKAAEILKSHQKTVAMDSSLVQKVHDALYAAKIIAYAQGMALIQTASTEYKWSLKLGEIAALWKGGCIIRAKFLNDIKQAYEANPNIANLMLADFMRQELDKSIGSLREVVSLASLSGVPVLTLSSALSYYDSYRLADLPQNLTQAQRDFFGAHTYQRKDKEGVFHTEWEE